MLYFAYGSNMSVKRITERVSSARKVCVGKLPGHELLFRKHSKIDGSAKCDIAQSEAMGVCVIGVVFDIAAEQIKILDRFEGLGNGYDSKTVDIFIAASEPVMAMAYYATSINSELKPYHWYKRHVLVGARENSLPQSYIRSIENIESVEDSDIERAELELAMYR